MKNILVDLIDTQEIFKGSGVYIRKVFLSLLKYIDSYTEYANVHLICTYDSRKKVLYSDLSKENLESNPQVTVVDISKTSFPEICSKYSVDTIFLGFGQQISNFDFTGIKSRTICVLHDIFDLEFKDTRLDTYLGLNRTFFQRSIDILYNLYLFLARRREVISENNIYEALVNYIKNNPNYIIVTVSQYSFYSIQSYLPIPENKIRVLWSPEKEMTSMKSIENAQLKKIIDSGKQYILMVSANRKLKNAEKAIKAFSAYKKNNSQEDLLMVVVGYRNPIVDEHIVLLPILSDGDIEQAYKNCYALIYPSFFEGFGYPPIEVMKYGKPVLSSNVCSMPEILGDAAIWFSPFYGTDIYRAICKLMNSDYSQWCKKSYDQYEIINKRQEADLHALIKLILS